METDEFDVNKKIKIEVPWEDELLCDKKVEVKSEPLELENQDTSNHEMMEVKDEFGKTMEDFDLSHVKSTSETVDCFDFKSLGCDKSSAHEIVCSNDFQNFAQRKSSIMPLFPEIEDYSYHCNQCPYSATSESNLTNHKEFVHKNVCDLKSNKSENPVGKDWKPDAHQPSKVIEPSRPKEPSNVGYQLKEDITAQGLNPTIDQSTFNEESKNNPTLNQSSNAFSQKNMLVSHQKKKHLNPKLHACQECQIVFLTKAKLDIHLKIVHQKFEHFSCQFCDRSFLLRIQLKNHQMKEHPNQKKELISNLKSVHENHNREFCDIMDWFDFNCSDSNSNDESEKKEKSEQSEKEAFESLGRDKSSHEIVSPNDFQNGSLQNFAQRKGTHLIDHNYCSELEGFHCKFCEARSRLDCVCSDSDDDSEEKPKNEEKSKNEKGEKEVKEKPKKYACNFNECEASYKNKTGLKNHHDAKHLNLKPFKCTECSSSFSEKGGLTKHTNRVHLNLKPFECTECQSSFSQKSDLTRHTNGVHLKLRPKCDQCGKSYISKQGLQTHINAVHLNLKLFKCSTCDASFATNYDLKKHIENVHQKPEIVLANLYSDIR